MLQEGNGGQRMRDLGNGKRIFDYDCNSESGSTQVWRGKYEGDVTKDDIIAAFGDGSWGHRGPVLYPCQPGKPGVFTYTQITD
jgi:hypothetical protein